MKLHIMLAVAGCVLSLAAGSNCAFAEDAHLKEATLEALLPLANEGDVVAQYQAGLRVRFKIVTSPVMLWPAVLR